MARLLKDTHEAIQARQRQKDRRSRLRAEGLKRATLRLEPWAAWGLRNHPRLTADELIEWMVQKVAGNLPAGDGSVTVSKLRVEDRWQTPVVPPRQKVPVAVVLKLDTYFKLADRRVTHPVSEVVEALLMLCIALTADGQPTLWDQPLPGFRIVDPEHFKRMTQGQQDTKHHVKLARRMAVRQAFLTARRPGETSVSR